MKQQYYVRYTYDRSGAQLLDIIYNYQYCIMNNKENKNNEMEFMGAVKKRHIRHPHLYNASCENTEQLIQYLNFPNKIINDDTSKMTLLTTNENTPKIIQPIFSKYLFNNCKSNLYSIKNEDKQDEFVVCVHIRRGDVKKDNKWKSRYTDDSYYLNLIKYIINIKPDSKIYLFSEKCFESEEKYSEYKKLGCIFMLGRSLVEAFNYFIQCDLFIMASSAFSIVPAIVKQNGICIYVWNKYFTPMDDWVICNDIDKDIDNIKQNISDKINKI